MKKHMLALSSIVSMQAQSAAPEGAEFLKMVLGRGGCNSNIDEFTISDELDSFSILTPTYKLPSSTKLGNSCAFTMSMKVPQGYRIGMSLNFDGNLTIPFGKAAQISGSTEIIGSAGDGSEAQFKKKFSNFESDTVNKTFNSESVEGSSDTVWSKCSSNADQSIFVKARTYTRTFLEFGENSEIAVSRLGGDIFWEKCEVQTDPSDVQTPEGFEVIKVSAHGTGCKRDSVTVDVSENRMASLFTDFNAHSAEANNIPNDTKYCNVSVVLEIPPGVSVSIDDETYKGITVIGEGGRAQLVTKYRFARAAQ